jgi:hypothetical protein
MTSSNRASVKLADSIDVCGSGGLLSSAIVAYGKWANRDVCVRRMPPTTLCGATSIRRRIKICALQLRSRVVHPNVLRFFGLTFAGLEEDCRRVLAVSEFAAKGRLTDVLVNEYYKLDDNFKFAMALDVAAGMAFLHGLDIVHGRLRCAHSWGRNLEGGEKTGNKHRKGQRYLAVRRSFLCSIPNKTI